ncbi:MAG: tetratricopeptide repeat protein [Leptospiraceae bacterium]|nr:tetratricopeptide repeat protein [Leptospiraceae bacterium]MCP5495346.1 tetratricopeptide repeat protein [Leptospiraceae bacterium]
MVSKNSLIVAGFVFLSAGILMSMYVYSIHQHEQTRNQIFEKIKEGEALLDQKSEKSAVKALAIFTELASKEIDKSMQFDIKYGLANSLERNKDKVLALDIYKELNQYPNLTKTQREKVSYSIGNILLSMEREEEGKSHLNLVLQMSEDKKLRSKVFISIADYYIKSQEYDEARKNYLLAIQEDPGNTNGRLGWKMALDLLGYSWDPYDIVNDYPKQNIQEKKMEKHSNVVKKPHLKVALNRKLKRYHARITSANVFGKALSYYRKKQYWSAIKNFQKTLKVTRNKKTRELSNYYIAECYYALGNSNGSLKYSEKVLSNTVPTKDQAALFRKGTIYFKNGNYKSAAAEFQKVISNYPNSNYTEKAKKWKKESLELISENEKFKERELLLQPANPK